MTAHSKFDYLPNLLVCDEEGKVYDIPELKMVGASGLNTVIPDEEDLIPLPAGSSIYLLPDRTPIGFNPETGKFKPLEMYRNKRIYPAAAFLAPAHLQIFSTAYKSHKNARTLPLYSYTAIGWKNGAYYTAAMRIDPDNRHDQSKFNDVSVNKGAESLLRRFNGNHVILHLVENCIRRYGCPNAKNLALGRSEAPAPVSPVCNARCAGCISTNHGKKVSCAQERITFVPDPGEIIEYAVPHLNSAKQAMLSFGQGCEGEPLMQFELIRDVIKGIRKATSKGTLHINTNGSKPELLEKLFRIGMDSIRVSLNSAREKFYLCHFRPVDYSFAHVVESIGLAKRLGKWCSINYLVFPGFTDTEDETESFLKLLSDTGADFVQIRNLNMDPEEVIQTLGKDAFEAGKNGMTQWLEKVKSACPKVGFGCYNPPKEKWGICIE